VTPEFRLEANLLVPRMIETAVKLPCKFRVEAFRGSRVMKSSRYCKCSPCFLKYINPTTCLSSLKINGYVYMQSGGT